MADPIRQIHITRLLSIEIGGLGAVGVVGAILPLLMVAPTDLELPVSAIEAYIFAMPTGM